MKNATLWTSAYKAWVIPNKAQLVYNGLIYISIPRWKIVPHSGCGFPIWYTPIPHVADNGKECNRVQYNVAAVTRM